MHQMPFSPLNVEKYASLDRICQKFPSLPFPSLPLFCWLSFFQVILFLFLQRPLS